MAVFTVVADTKTEIGGAATDDRYVIDPFNVQANQTVTITDTLGANIIQLTGGLQIASSNVTSNAIQLTLSNGAVITILGADTFQFQTGGNGTNGTGGVTQSFADFAQNVLGVTVPAPGADPVVGGGSETNEDGSATIEGQGPVLALTASANSVDEGASVDVSVTGAAANSTVAYTITGTGVDAADVNSLTGTITTDANGAGTASIAVTADNATEGEETMTVTLDGTTVSTDIKINDTSVAPQTVELTTGTDDIQPADGSQTINGVVSALSSEATLNAGDKIDGGAGEDTLNADMKLGFSGFSSTGFLKGVENVNLTNSSQIARTFDATGVTGATTYNVTGNINLQDLDSVAAVNLTDRASQDFTVAYASNVTDGTSDTLALGLNNVGTKADSKATPAVAEASVTITAAGIEALNLTSTGMNVIDLAAGGAKDITATGAGYLEINDLGANAKTFDGSAATGTLDITLGAATGMSSVQTGTGDDKLAVVIGDDVTGTAVIADAGGADTLTLTGSGGVQLTQSGIETVSLNLGGDTTLSFLNTTGVTKLVAEDSLGGNVIVANSSGDFALDLQGAAAAGTARTVTLDTTGTVSIGAVSTSSNASATARDTANDNVTLTKSGTVVLDVASDVTYTGTVTATDATSVNAAIKGQANANLIAGKASSVIISEVGQNSTLDLDVEKATTVDITNAKGVTLANGNLGAVQVFNSKGAGDLTITNAGANALSAVNQATIANTGSVALGDVGSNTQEYSANVTLSGTGATTVGTMSTKDQAITLSGSSTGAVSAGVINAITGNVTVDVDTTSTLGLLAITGKDVTLDSGGVLGKTTYGGNINASGNVTIVGSNLEANDIDGTGAGKIVLTGDTGSAQSVALTGGIFADTIAIDTAAKNQTVTITGDLAGGTDDVKVTGQLGDQTISIAGLSNYDAATITGGAGADKLTGGAGTDTLVVDDADTLVDGGAGSDTLNFAADATFTAAELANVETATATADANLTVASADVKGANNISTFNGNGAGALDKLIVKGTDAADTLDYSTGLTIANDGQLQVDAGAGNDTVTGTGGADILNGEAGDDTLTGGAGADSIATGTGSDTVVLVEGDSVAYTAATFAGASVAANDTITFGNGVDVVTDFTAGAGGDILKGVDAAAVPTTGIGVATANGFTGDTFFLSGAYNQTTGVFTVAADGAGADTMILDVENHGANPLSAVDDAVILIGVDSDDLVAANFVL